MTSSTGSISLTGLLGGTAGQIDVTSLINSLMTAASVPQQQLQDKLQTEATQLSTYQAINTKLASLLAAGQKLTDPSTWTATAATSSSNSVVASSTAGAPLGTTTFNVVQLAQAQVSTISAGADGNFVNAGSSITITGSDGTQHTITPTAGDATDVVAAINAAKIGVTANVVTADDPTTPGSTIQLLQLTSTSTGTAGAFTPSGFENDASLQTIVTAQQAQIQVGGANGYTVSSSTNSFKNVIPGVTFSVSAPANNVTLTVGNNEHAISNAVSSLVNAANAANAEINTDTAQGAVLAANTSVENIGQSILSTVSRGTSDGASLSTYGISIDKNGVMSFDAGAFASAYDADPTGTQNVISQFATSLNSVTTNATDPTYGSVTTTMQQISATSASLTTEIGDWATRLQTIKAQYTTKFTAMETALAKLQSQQSYLTSMFNSMNNNDNGSGSSSS